MTGKKVSLNELETFNYKDYISLYKSCGLSIVPLYPSTKIPVVSFDRYCNRQPSDEEVAKWLSTFFNPEFWKQVWQGKRRPTLREKWLNALELSLSKEGRRLDEYNYEGEINIAVIGGVNDLILIDIEDATKIEELKDKSEKEIVEYFKSFGFVVVKTGKPNGYHLWALCKEWKWNKKGTNGEIRARKQYVVAPPSKHPNGQQYKFLTDFELKYISPDIILEKCLKWIGCEEKRKTIEKPREEKREDKPQISEEELKKKEKQRLKEIWKEIKEQAKRLDPIVGIRSDWTFALTVASKLFFESPEEAFKELIEIPIVKDKVIRKGWDEKKGYEWWLKYEWQDAQQCPLFALPKMFETIHQRALTHFEDQYKKKHGEDSMLYTLLAEIDKKGKEFISKVRTVISNYLISFKKKGYGHVMSEEDLIKHLVKYFDKELVVIQDEVVTVVEDWLHIVVTKLNEAFYFIAIEETDELLIYQGGVYKPCEKYIQKLLQKVWDRTKKVRKVLPLTKSRVDEIIFALKRLNYVPLEEVYEIQKRYINVKNGIIDLQDFSFKPHNPQLPFITQLNVEYDESAYAPEWDNFLKQVVRTEEEIKTLQEFCGYCLLNDTRYEKALIIVGPGGSGKSTFLEAIRSVFGIENTTAFSLQQLEEERFTRAELIGKIANIYNDLPYEALRKTDIFKQIVSSDPVQVEKKYQQPFMARLTTKLIFSANQLPRVDDESRAFFRRLLIVTFPNVIENPDRTLKFKLQSEYVKSYIFKWMLDGLRRLLQQNKFTLDYGPDEIEELYRRASDSVFAFIHDHVEKCDGAKIRKTQLYQLYCEYCREKGYPMVSSHAFSRRLKQYLPFVQEKKIRGERYWINIKYVESKEEVEEVEESVSEEVEFTESEKEEVELDNVEREIVETANKIMEVIPNQNYQIDLFVKEIKARMGDNLRVTLEKLEKLLERGVLQSHFNIALERLKRELKEKEESKEKEEQTKENKEEVKDKEEAEKDQKEAEKSKESESERESEEENEDLIPYEKMLREGEVKEFSSSEEMQKYLVNFVKNLKYNVDPENW